jgi:hypothetical protein
MKIKNNQSAFNKYYIHLDGFYRLQPFIAFALLASAYLLLRRYSEISIKEVIATWPIHQFNLIISRPSNLNWTDVSENILASYLIANDWKLYQDFVMNHMPGVPIFLGIIYKAINVENLNPGNGTTNLLYIIALYASSIFQISCIYFGSKRNLEKNDLTCLLIGIFYAWYFLVRSEFALPLSESLITALVFLLVSRLIYLIKHGISNPIKESFSFLTIIAIINFIGLTILPTTIIASVIFALLLACSPKLKIIQIFNKKTLLICILSALLLLVVLSPIGVQNIFYWNIKFNQNIHPSLLSNIFTALTPNRLALNLYSKYSLLCQINLITVFILIFGILYSHIFRRKGFLGSISYFMIGVGFIAFFLSFVWRDPDGVKVYPLGGFILLIMAQMMPNIAAPTPPKWINFMGAAIALCLSCVSVFFTISLINFNNTDNAFDRLISLNKVCHFRESAN